MERSMDRAVVVLAVLITCVTAAFAVVALVDPARIAPGAHGPAAHDLALMFAARSLALGVAVVVALVLDPRSATCLVLLGAAATAQLVDVAIGLRRRVPGQVVGPAVAVLVYLGALWWFVRS